MKVDLRADVINNRLLPPPGRNNTYAPAASINTYKSYKYKWPFATSIAPLPLPLPPPSRSVLHLRVRGRRVFHVTHARARVFVCLCTPENSATQAMWTSTATPHAWVAGRAPPVSPGNVFAREPRVRSLRNNIVMTCCLYKRARPLLLMAREPTNTTQFMR